MAVAVTLVLWASAFVGIRAGLRSYSPGALALLRYLVASLALGWYLAFDGTQLPGRREWPRLALAGAVGIALYNLALNTGERTLTAGAASFIGNTAPVLSALLAAVFLRERLRWVAWFGTLLAFGGAGLIAAGEPGGIRAGRGALFCLAAALSQSIYFVLIKPPLARYGTLPVACFVFWSGAVCLLPFASALAAEVRRAPFADTAAVVYLGVGPAAVGYVLWGYALARMPVARTTSFLYFVPALATAIGWVWLRELPAALSIAGGVVALAGVVVVNRFGRAPAEAGS
jgi:drug/metabolite transporter (DMT)-like permease